MDDAARQKSRKEDIAYLNNCFFRCFSSKDGKEVLEYLKGSYHINETTLVGVTEKGMLEGILISEGQRMVILDILNRMELSQEENNG